MKKILLIPILLMFMGCMTDNALKAEQSYYKAISDMQTQKASQPIFELVPAKAGEPITLGNVGSFKVFAPPANSGQNLSQYQHKDYVQPWLNVLGAAVPWLGVWGVSHAIVGGMKEMGGTSYNQSGTGNKLVGGESGYDLYANSGDATRTDYCNATGSVGGESGDRTMITIQQSKTADTRSCDFSKVTRNQLLESSIQHIGDVRLGMEFLKALMAEAADRHDFDKITGIDHFHADFITGFKETGWWDNHRKVNRHHLLQDDGVPADVNLIDVLDMIVDCVMAGMGRTGNVYPLDIKPETLRTAFNNTVSLLKEQVVVIVP